jgi:predicted HTH domain antitoxin
MSISVTFPDELLVASKEDEEQFSRHVKIYTLGHLYEQGKVSSGLGAWVLNCDRREFYRLLAEFGFSVIDYLPSESEEEAQTSREIADRISPFLARD